MSMSELRVGIVGIGGIADGKHLPALAKFPNVKMVAFCDLIEEKAKVGAQKYGVSGAKVCTDYQEMLGMDLDIVHVCTPNSSHAEISVTFLDNGSHVMCEKPMAHNAESARKMMDAVRRTGKLLEIGYDNRFRADSLYLKQLCENSELGEIYFAKAIAIRRRAVPTWGVFLDGEKQGGGPLIDIGTHALDLTLWLMDNYEPVSVVGSTFHKLSQRENAANAWGPWDPQKFTVEDSAFGFIKFKNGATVTLEASWALNYVDAREAVCVLCGTEGGADFHNGLRINGEKYSKLYLNKIQLDGKGVAFYSGDQHDRIAIEFQTWLDAVTKGTPQIVKPEQALVVSEILEAIYQSSASGQPVNF
jgi:predicted dehydrogenase